MSSKIDRQTEILRLVHAEGKVLVTTLAEIFKVSTVLIRKDLYTLVSLGLMSRCYGGAIVLSNLARVLKSHEAKVIDENDNRLALAAVNTISNGDSLILASSDISECISDNLYSHKKLKVLTNNLKVVTNLAVVNDIEIMITGGKLRKKSQSLFGRQAENTLNKLHFDKVILHVDNFDLSVGISTNFAQKATLEELMCEKSSEIIVICKSLNFGKSSCHVIRSNRKISTMITDSNINKDQIESVEKSGIKLIITDLPVL